ncbi:MAG: tryptophan 2,3-dioxygenase [Acidimicrobiales bacterium]
MAITYNSYLKIDELLELQERRSEGPEHDEMLFIIIHQVYELWFKQVLHEADLLAVHIREGRPSKGAHQLKRILKILKTLVSQLDVLETMTPLEFMSFRSFLANSSGFQSAQFRELEYLLGLKDPQHLERFAEGSKEHSRLQARYTSPSIWDAFLDYLHEQGFAIPDEILKRDVTAPNVASREVQLVLIQIYRTRPDLVEICESLTDLDEGLQEWRYRHVKMVQRTIGAKIGTGGSLGVEYLQTTLFKPVFADLWAIRTEF